MDIFEEKLEGNRGEILPFSGRTLDGRRKSPANPGPFDAPFPLEEAAGRFQSLRQEGVSCVRLVIAWEALEYAGPGVYDESYLAYLRKILIMADQEGIAVFIDPVQNQWSRWAGGEGHPPWALEQGNLDQAQLQERYLNCMRHCFRRLKNCRALIGWGGAAADLSEPFMLRFASRMREAREGIRFFIAENPGEAERFTETGDQPEWAAGAFCYYDARAFPGYQDDLAINASC
ncbi:MAG: cellulase family glycosylhydrolase [Treponema sp.]|jgi:hypothetical protein|nr:cellulase family glycosylhydrolase [Treponema sp.]